jgi:hypothetical protein
MSTFRVSPTNRCTVILPLHDVDLAVIEEPPKAGASRNPYGVYAERRFSWCTQRIQQRFINVLPTDRGRQGPHSDAGRLHRLREIEDFPASKFSDITDAFVYALT